MLKKIRFNLIKIKYTGTSIGENIKLNIEMLDKNLQIDKRIKAGKSIELTEEIGNFPTDQKTFLINTRITITENDVLFNDANSIEKLIKVDTDSPKAQVFICEIELREKRFWKNWGKSIAKFEITIEALPVDKIKYIPDIDNGWLKVKMIEGGTVSLPSFLRVQSDHIESGREYFTILEGRYKDRKASVSLDSGNNNASRLLINVKHESSIYLKYSISKKKLTINGKKYDATDYSNSPLKKGWYDIELPDFPHSGGQYYLDASSRAKTWFKIGHEGERYLHTGRRSLGCITITETKKWDEIYNKLIKARKGDFLSAGVLEVAN